MRGNRVAALFRGFSSPATAAWRCGRARSLSAAALCARPRSLRARPSAAPLHVSIDAVPDHPVALDKLADAGVEGVEGPIARRLDLGVGDDVIALVRILADRRLDVDEAGDLRLDPLAELCLR